MTDVMIDLERPLPSLVSKDIPSLSDDECLVRLAQAVADPEISEQMIERPVLQHHHDEVVEQ